MPVDMKTKKIYKIDYKRFYAELDSQQFFSDRRIQTIYLTKWFELLQLEDEAVVDCFNNNKNNILIELQQAPEIFQLPLELKFGTIYVHFRVSRILEALEKCNVSLTEPMEFAIEEFKKHDSYINWTETNDIVTIKQQPILMVPFTIDKYYKLLNFPSRYFQINLE